MTDVVQDVGNEASTEQAETSIKPLCVNGSMETTLTTDSLAATSSDPESTASPLTTSTEEKTPGSFSTPSSSEEKASTGDQGIEEADVTMSKMNEDHQVGEETTTTMVVGADVTTSKMNEDYVEDEETRIKSGGAVVNFRVNERDSNQNQGCFLNIILACQLFDDNLRLFGL